MSRLWDQMVDGHLTGLFNLKWIHESILKKTQKNKKNNNIIFLILPWSHWSKLRRIINILMNMTKILLWFPEEEGEEEEGGGTEYFCHSHWTVCFVHDTLRHHTNTHLDTHTHTHWANAIKADLKGIFFSFLSVVLCLHHSRLEGGCSSSHSFFLSFPSLCRGIREWRTHSL